MPYEDLRLTALPVSSYEDSHLTEITCTMLRIFCKSFFRSLYNCLINRFSRELKDEPHIICNL